MTHVYHATQKINCTKKIRPHVHTDERSGCNKVTVHYNILKLLQNIILKIADQKSHDITLYQNIIVLQLAHVR